MKFTYVAFTTGDGDLFGGLLTRNDNANTFLENYEDARLVCRVPLKICGATGAERKQDFLSKMNTLCEYPVELSWWEEGFLMEWIEKTAARTGTVRQLRQMNIL